MIRLNFQFLFSLDKGQDEPDTIGPEGVEKLCKDLGVDPEDVRTFFFPAPPPPLFFPSLSCPCLLVFFFCGARAWLLVSLVQDQISRVHIAHYKERS